MARHQDVLVIGLGRFGRPLAETLIAQGRDVLGIDVDLDRVQACSETITRVVQADAREADALRQLGVDDFPSAVVAIGGDIEASILTTYALVDLGVEQIWARALTADHGEILRRIGASVVVYPERDMADRVAHSMVGRTLDYFALDDGMALVESTPPREMVGRSLAETRPRSRYGVTVLMVKRPGGSFEPVDRDTVIGPDDLLVVGGDKDSAAAFSDLE